MSLWSLPESFTDVLTVVVLVCAAFFLDTASISGSGPSHHDVLRLSHPAHRHSPFPDRVFRLSPVVSTIDTVMILHILSGELMLITIPFTKFGHMLFFFLYRFLIGSEYSFARGGRTW